MVCTQTEASATVMRPISCLLLLLLLGLHEALAVIHGKYTDNIKDYHLVVPHRATPDGEFHSFHLPYAHAYDSGQFMRRRKRQLEDPDALHYGVLLDNELRHLELWPNRDFVHPQAIFEKRDITVPVSKMDIRGLKNKKMCYYLGRVRGADDSRAAISTCDGLLGYVQIGAKTFFIEPVKGHSPNGDGHHLHVVHYPSAEGAKEFCGVRDTATLWDQAMKERLEQNYLGQGSDVVFKRDVDEEIAPQYIEILAVCDKRMVMKHKGHRDIEQWVLTMFSVMKSFYSEASMTFIIEPVLVRVIYLEKEEEEIDLDITRSYKLTLISICKWAKGLQPKDVTHPNHFDIVTLLSDWDFCDDAGECGVTGFANMCDACSSHRNCLLIEDEGILSTVTLAHEIGHLVGMEHDGSNKVPCPSMDPADNSSYVMSLYNRPFTVRWSPCSMASMHRLSSEHVLDCFKDEPNNDEYPLFDVIPGVAYDKDEQCKLHFRKNPNVTGWCTEIGVFECEKMYCKQPFTEGEDENRGCIADGWGWAPGTTCREETEWCMRNKCMPRGTIPDSVDGGWGEWGEWSECSRSCGRGLQTKERVCDNPKPENQGRFCLGQSKMSRVCNPQDCPSDSRPFREQRCLIDLPKLKKNLTFESVQFDESAPCKSTCWGITDTGQAFVYIAAKRIADGAKCQIGNPLKMCVFGSCKEVPCDNKLEGSTAAVDRCGICNGDGTMCRQVEGNDTASPPSKSRYAQVALIPAGARSVKIWNTDRCETVMLLGKPDGNTPIWHLTIAWGPGVYPLPPNNLTFFKYTRPFWTGNFREKFDKRTITWDRTKEDVGLYLYNWNTSLNVVTKWSWMEPTTVPQFEPKYRWQVAEYGKCDVKCGGGTQEPKIQCFEQTAGLVSDQFCEKLDKPSDPPQKCNEEPCKPEWKVGTWGKCRACKKKGGVRIRSVECVRPNSKTEGDDILLEDTECTDLKPGTVELCATRKKCTSRKRQSIYVPGQFQDTVWEQMHGMHLKKRGAYAHSLARAKAAQTTKRSTTFTWTAPPVSDIMDELVVDKVVMGESRGDQHVGEEVFVPIKVVKTNVTSKGDNAMMDPEVGTVIVVGSPVIRKSTFAHVGSPNTSFTCPAARNET